MAPEAIDQRFVEHLLPLTDGVTDRITDLLKGAAIETVRTKAKFLTLDGLMIAGGRMPNLISQSGGYPFNDTLKHQ